MDGSQRNTTNRVIGSSGDRAILEGSDAKIENWRVLEDVGGCPTSRAFCEKWGFFSPDQNIYASPPSISLIGNMNVAEFATLYCDIAGPSRSQSTSNLKHMMKLGGFLLLLSGWGIVITALFLLHGSVVFAFVYAGVAVEIMGLVLVFRGHLPPSEDEG